MVFGIGTWQQKLNFLCKCKSASKHKQSKPKASIELEAVSPLLSVSVVTAYILLWLAESRAASSHGSAESLDMCLVCMVLRSKDVAVLARAPVFVELSSAQSSATILAVLGTSNN